MLKAYDQSQEANQVYSYNFGEVPVSRNLDTISGDSLPAADIWWLSPPCKPFTRRGKRNDIDDPRAKALLNLIKILPSKKPAFLVLENVGGFRDSRAEELFLSALESSGYNWRMSKICPSEVGIPMQRPRLFYAASLLKTPAQVNFENKAILPLSQFIKEIETAGSLKVKEELDKRYRRALNTINQADSNSKAICFTSGYGKSTKASGTLIELSDGCLRHFSPEEILALLGFPENYKFPEQLRLQAAWRLAGNSVDLRSLRVILTSLL